MRNYILPILMICISLPSITHALSFSSNLVKIEDTLLNLSLKNSEYKFSEIEKATAKQFKYSIILGVTVESLNNEDLLNFIENWYGVKYMFGGNSKKGIDCSAFTQTLLKDVYGITTDRIAGDQYYKCQKIRREDLAIGDLLFFKHKNKSYITHVAFYLGNNKFIHASVNKGITIDDLRSKYYSNIFHCAGRPRN